MNRELILRPEAEDDLAGARDWYDSQREGLGDEFLDAVAATFILLETSPELFPRVHRDLRGVRVTRFPYLVIYLVEPARITIYAVYHTSRDSRGWERRYKPGPPNPPR